MTSSKFSLITYSTENLGDDIQSLAAASFLPKVDYYVDRECLIGAMHYDPSFLIANGYFLHNKYGFLPPPSLNPFYISLHLTDRSILIPEVRDYLLKKGPIGCRDFHTSRLLSEAGISNYFSGCLTLTLKRRVESRTSEIVICDLDPRFLEIVPKAIRDQATFVTHNTETYRIHGSDNAAFASQRSYRIRIARRLFPSNGELLRKMTEQMCLRRMTKFSESQKQTFVFQRHQEAENLLQLYSRAKLVITSRLHCALPCSAFGTPVLFLHPNPLDPRFDGINRFIKIYSIPNAKKIPWNPEPNQIQVVSQQLESLCKKAVQLGRNPLQGESEDFFPQAA